MRLGDNYLPKPCHSYKNEHLFAKDLLRFYLYLVIVNTLEKTNVCRKIWSKRLRSALVLAQFDDIIFVFNEFSIQIYLPQIQHLSTNHRFLTAVRTGSRYVIFPPLLFKQRFPMNDRKRFLKRIHIIEHLRSLYRVRGKKAKQIQQWLELSKARIHQGNVYIFFAQAQGNNILGEQLFFF